MHVPDGFLDAPTSVATGAIAVGAVGLALTRAEAEVRRSGPALAGLTASFVFAVQMVNFPVGPGTSGHLMGGALAAALVGPWTAVLCLTAVLVVQALLFADGGITALGTNVLLIGLTTVLVGYLVARLLVAVLPRRQSMVVPAAAVGAALSVPAAALVFVLLYLAGGAVAVPASTLATAMLGWHALIGVGEAVITAAVLGVVVRTRPDLVHLARGSRPALLVRKSGSAEGSVPAQPVNQAQPRPRGLLAGAGLVTLVVAGLAGLVASANPDGLEFVGEQLGFGEHALPSATADSPFADYGVQGLAGAWGTGVAGLLGVLVTVTATWLVVRLAQRRRPVGHVPAAAADDERPHGPDSVPAGRTH